MLKLASSPRLRSAAPSATLSAARFSPPLRAFGASAASSPAGKRVISQKENFPQPHDPPRTVRTSDAGHKAVFTLEHPSTKSTTLSKVPGHHLAVAVHGAPGSTWDWRYVGPALTKLGIPLLRLDLPGHGDSSRELSRSADGRTMARALWKMVQIADGHGASACAKSAAAQGASTEHAHETVVNGFTAAAAAPGARRDIVLIGHSLGCELALHAAAECIRASDRDVPADAPKIAGIVLVNPVGLRPHKALRPFAVARFLGRAMDWPAPFGGLMKALVYQFWIRVFGFSPRTKADEVEWGQRRVAARDFVKLAEDVALVRARGVPSGVLYARDDHLVEPAVPEELAEALGSRHVVLCESGGHYLNKWQGNEIASLVAQLLAEGHGRVGSVTSQSASPASSAATSASAVPA